MFTPPPKCLETPLCLPPDLTRCQTSAQMPTQFTPTTFQVERFAASGVLKRRLWRKCKQISWQKSWAWTRLNFACAISSRKVLSSQWARRCLRELRFGRWFKNVLKKQAGLTARMAGKSLSSLRQKTQMSDEGSALLAGIRTLVSLMGLPKIVALSSFLRETRRLKKRNSSMPALKLARERTPPSPSLQLKLWIFHWRNLNCTIPTPPTR